MKKWWLIIFLSLPFLTKAQNIITFAGGGTGGLGDGWPATAAAIADPITVAFDKIGNSYIVSGLGGNRIRKVDVSGIITTVVGTGTGGYSGDGFAATAAELNTPRAIAFDTMGNLYIADGANNAIRKVNIATGIISTIAGTGTAGYNGDNISATSALLNEPNDICFDKSGNLYVADEENSRVRKVNTSGIITTFAGNGVYGFSGDNGPATSAQLWIPWGLAIDDTGNLYISDESNFRIRKVDTFGIITTFAGNGNGTYIGDGISATNAQFTPAQIKLNDSGNLFIGDYDANYRVLMIDHAGIIHSIAGNGTAGFSGDGGPATAAEFNYPGGIAFDYCDNLYIGDVGNRRVRKVLFNTTGTPAITISPSPNDTVCTGSSVIYTATVTGSGTFTYNWYVNGAVVSTTGSTYTYTPANGDSIRCLFYGTDICSGSPDTVSSNNINMVVTPYTEPSISLSGITGAAVGALVTITATVTNAGSSYNINWYDNGTLFNTTTVPTVTYTKAAGTDNITATVISTSVGCYDSTTSAVHTVTVTPEGVNTVTLQAISIYPNPANDVLYIDGVSNTSLSLGEGRGEAYSIINIVGIVMQQGILKAGSNNISVQSLPEGIYMVEVTGNEGDRIIKKIIKQ